MRTDRTSTLRFYLTIIRRRWLPMLIVFLIPIAIAVALTISSKKEYQGTALVVINRQSLADELTGATNPSASSSDFLNIITTYADAAHSTEVADRVASAVPQAHLTGEQLLGKSSAAPRQDADVITFSVRNGDPALALRLAREFARQFVSYQQGLSIASINAALRQVDARLRQARAANDRSLISGLTGRDQQLRTLKSLQTANDYVVHPTTTATLTSPKRSLDIGLGVVAGIVLAGLLAALLEALDTRVRTADDVEEILGTPLLGRLEPPQGNYRTRVLSLLDPSNARAEGFRILRTNLELQTLGEDARVVMVTSSEDMEGKSLTLANLAVAAARSGRDVVLVDMDLRRPTQDTLFQTGARVPGLTNVMLGTVSLQEALVEIPLPPGRAGDDDGRPQEGSLRLLRAGLLPPDPGELVASEQAESVIAALRDQADVVYVDCPPMLVAGDALTISRFCDVVLLVARIPRVKRRMLADVARGLATSPARVAGFVVTGDKKALRPTYS